MEYRPSQFNSPNHRVAQDYFDDLIQWSSVLATHWNHLERFKKGPRLRLGVTHHYSEALE